MKREQGGNHLAQVAKSQRTVQGKRGRGDNKPVRVSLERSLALYCTLGLHPLASTSETGFRSVMTAAYYPMEPPAFTEEDVYVVLMREHESLVRHIKKTMASQLKFIPFGPCASMQLHTWSAGGIPYTFAAMSASFVTPQYKWNRCGLAVHAFSAESFTSTGVAQWVRDVTAEYFGPGVEPSSVFLACTIGRGEPLSSALTALGISESLGCSILALDGVVRGSLSGPAATFVNRLLEVTEPFATPGASEGTHLAVQSALGACMAHAAADQSSLQNVLELMQRMLSSRSLLLQHAAENPCSPQLSQAEWHALQDAFGLLEACAEVDIGIRSLHPLPLSTSIGLFQELQQYLSEDVRENFARTCIAPEANASILWVLPTAVVTFPFALLPFCAGRVCSRP